MQPHERGGGLPATCGGCGCECDDIRLWEQAGRIERLDGTCPLGDMWFSDLVAAGAPAARIEGVEAELSAAIEEAAAVLADARLPLVYGLGQASCEAQREALAISEAIGAVVDPAGGVLDGSSASAFQALGASTATLGEIRDRAEIVVVWRADPSTTQPRLLPRLRFDQRRRGAGGARVLVVVDAERTATAGAADVFIELPAELDFDALWALRALVRAVPVVRELAPDLPWPELEQLSVQLRGCGHVAFIYDGGLASAPGGEMAALALEALIRDLNGSLHAVSAIPRREGNAVGAESVLTWQTGFPGAVSFARGSPRANADEFSAAAVLSCGDVDAALVVASDPLEHLPRTAAEGLRAIPTITIDARDTATADVARVAFTTAAAGVHASGTAHRLDGVPVALRAPLEATRPQQEKVLRALAERVAVRLSESRTETQEG